MRQLAPRDVAVDVFVPGVSRTARSISGRGPLIARQVIRPASGRNHAGTGVDSFGMGKGLTMCTHWEGPCVF